MTCLRALHQIIDYMSWGDAISNHTLLLRNLLRSWGIHSEIYTCGCDPHMATVCRPLRECQLARDDWLIYQYSLDSLMTEFALAHPAQTILNYHNITPPHFYEAFDSSFAARLQHAIHDLERLRDLAGAVSESRYNCEQLEEMGFSPVTHIPLLFSLDELKDSAASPRGRRLYKQLADGQQNILFIGRIAPNKRFEHLIHAFHYYHRLIQPASRLLLLGASPHGIYQAYLDMLVESLGLTDSVTFAGRVPLDEGFGAFYQAADVFLCLSEHEGFAVPLIESMDFDLPVIAYGSSAVPETMGDSGVLLTEKRYDVIGELIYNLLTDLPLRQQINRKQRERLVAFNPAVVKSQVKAWVESLEGI